MSLSFPIHPVMHPVLDRANDRSSARRSGAGFIIVREPSRDPDMESIAKAVRAVKKSLEEPTDRPVGKLQKKPENLPSQSPRPGQSAPVTQPTQSAPSSQPSQLVQPVQPWAPRLGINTFTTDMRPKRTASASTRPTRTVSLFTSSSKFRFPRPSSLLESVRRRTRISRISENEATKQPTQSPVRTPLPEEEVEETEQVARVAKRSPEKAKIVDVPASPRAKKPQQSAIASSSKPQGSEIKPLGPNLLPTYAEDREEPGVEYEYYRCDVHGANSRDFAEATKECKQLVAEAGGRVLDEYEYLAGFLYALPTLTADNPLESGDKTAQGGHIEIFKWKPWKSPRFEGFEDNDFMKLLREGPSQ